jgi:hypothetical protein
LLLHISRLTDARSDVLTVQRLPNLVKIAIPGEVQSRLDAVLEAADFARDLRNRHIAHRSIDVALARPATPLPPASRESLINAILSVDRLLHFVEHYLLNTEPTLYDHLDSRGGWSSLLDIVQRGLQDRDRQFAVTNR